LRRSVVEIGSAEVGVRRAVFEHGIDRRQDRGGDGAEGRLRAALGLKAEKLGAGSRCPWPAWPPANGARIVLPGTVYNFGPEAFPNFNETSPRIR
jgi:hypothetical protein